VEYWHIHDVDRATAEKSLGEIESQIRQLVARLQSSEGEGHQVVRHRPGK
jgi:hypothetical protein